MQVAQVAVDTVTYSAEIEEFWSAQEVGRVLNPVLAGGQGKLEGNALTTSTMTSAPRS